MRKNANPQSGPITKSATASLLNTPASSRPIRQSEGSAEGCVQLQNRPQGHAESAGENHARRQTAQSLNAEGHVVALCEKRRSAAMPARSIGWSAWLRSTTMRKLTAAERLGQHDDATAARALQGACPERRCGKSRDQPRRQSGLRIDSASTDQVGSRGLKKALSRSSCAKECSRDDPSDSVRDGA